MSYAEVLRHSEGRYLTAEERERLLAFARDVPGRVRAGEEVEQAEGAVVAAACDELRENYPRFGRVHAQAWDRLAHDLRLVLRYDVRAMLADDARALDDKLLYYLRSVWAAYHVTPPFVRDALTLLRDRLRGRLSPESFGHLEPFLDRNLAVLADIPEPAVAAV
jgi:hypothetical protein